MKKLYFLLFAGMMIVGGIPLRAQTMQTCEYWFDYDFAGRQSVSMNGSSSFQQEFDLSALPRGVHSIGLRFGDSEGRWGAPIVKHFVIPSLPAETFPDNRIVRMEYWLDGDFDHRQTLENANGTVALALDLATLSPGAHSIAYRALDGHGLWSSPFVKHFVVPSQPEPAITGMAAYEYWFNHGKRVRVEVAKQKTLDLSDVVIEIKDVVPNRITSEYRFNAAEEMVYCADEVIFGIQAFDDAGHPSSAVLSDKFDFDVPVHPHFLTLENMMPTDYAAPAASAMQGFKVAAEVGDSVEFQLKGRGQFDLYDSEGNKVECQAVEDDETGLIIYKAKASTATMYALLWNVSPVVDAMQVTYVLHKADRIDDIGTEPVHDSSTIYSLTGVRMCGNGSGLSALPSGIYIVGGKKVVVK